MHAMSEMKPEDQGESPIPFNYGAQTEILAAHISSMGTESDELAVMRHGVDENYLQAFSGALDTPIYRAEDPTQPRIGLIEGPGFLFSILPELLDRADILLVTGRDVNLMQWLQTTANTIREHTVPGDCLEALVTHGGEEVREELENEHDIMGPLHFLHDQVRLTECRTALGLSNIHLQATDIGHLLVGEEIRSAVESVSGTVTFASLSNRGDEDAPYVARLMDTLPATEECPIIYASRFRGWDSEDELRAQPIVTSTPYTSYCLGAAAYKTAIMSAWNALPH